MLIYPGTCYTRSGTTLVLRAHQQPYSQTVQSYNVYCVLLCFCLLLGWAWVSLVPRRGTRLSLSEPHTSVAALHINLYVYVCLLGPTKLNEHIYNIWWRLNAFGRVHFSSAWEQEWSVKYWCEGDQELAQLRSKACMVTYYIMMNKAGCSDHNDRHYARWSRSL